jgi:hypothetical protein
MNTSDITRFHLRDLFVAIAFFALLEGADFLYLWITDQFMPGFGSVPMALLFFILIVIFTILAAVAIRNVVLGACAILLFYLIIALRDIVFTDARVADVATTCAASFLVHAGAYVSFALIIRRTRKTI